MPKPICNSCCIFLELRDGSILIGYWNLIGSIVAAILTYAYSGDYLETSVPADSDEEPIGVFSFVCIILFIAGLFIFSIVLLVGLHKDKPGYVKCYLIFNVITLVIFVIMYIMDIVSEPDEDVIVFYVVITVVSVYFTLVIQSYYCEMLLKNSNRLHQNPLVGHVPHGPQQQRW